ncbi:MAG: hypothetical protein IKN43_02485 [Selenomonadaceae bacterium]|nr:hypothetical protein [Selenomonadaceae bacterium]
MAIIRKTMEEILKEVTKEDIDEMCRNLETHVDEYDPENPPMDEEELAELHEIMERRRQNRINSSVKISA